MSRKADFRAILLSFAISLWTSTPRMDSLKITSSHGVIALMALFSIFKRILKGVLVPAVFLAVSGYFAWHAVHGERGLMARDKRQGDVVAARAALQYRAQATPERAKALEDASGLWVFACYGAAGFAPFAGALLG
jgi:hypothetical protein